MERLSITVVAFAFLTVSAVPTDKHRPMVTKDLSDHEAFLGEDKAQTFDQLSPAEAKRRLGMIVDKIDKNGDGNVTEQELVDWVRHVARRYVFDDVDRHWGYYDKDEDGQISWEGYRSTYGVVENVNEIHDHNRNLTFSQTIERYQKRFFAADQNDNKALDKEEFADFLHPQDAPHMRDIVIDETLMDMDKNQDGVIELEEYLNDLWPPSKRDTEEKPDWLKEEQAQFSTHRDKDGNRKLDREELGDWILPLNFDPAVSEAKHLIQQADVDKNKILSKAEIMDHQDVFVGSQATDYGNYFMRHDEF